MKPLGKTQSSPQTGSNLSALAFERGDCRLYQDVLAGYDASSLPRRGEGSQHAPEHPGRRQGRKVSKDTHAALLQTWEPVLQHPGSHARHRTQEPSPSSRPIPSHPQQLHQGTGSRGAGWGQQDLRAALVAAC